MIHKAMFPGLLALIASATPEGRSAPGRGVSSKGGSTKDLRKRYRQRERDILGEPMAEALAQRRMERAARKRHRKRWVMEELD